MTLSIDIYNLIVNPNLHPMLVEAENIITYPTKPTKGNVLPCKTSPIEDRKNNMPTSIITSPPPKRGPLHKNSKSTPPPSNDSRRVIFSCLHDIHNPPQRQGLQINSESSDSFVSDTTSSSGGSLDSTLTPVASLIHSPILNALHKKNLSIEPTFQVRKLNRSLSILRSKSESREHERSGVKFDPRVWVHQYPHVKGVDRDSLKEGWYTQDELRRLELETIKCIRDYTARNSACVGLKEYRNKPFFCHPALSHEAVADDKDETLFDDRIFKKEIKRVLIVDPNTIFLYLFSKSIKSLMPHVLISTARSTSEALGLIKTHSSLDGSEQPTHGFDIIIVEEQLYSPSNWPSAEECFRLQNNGIPITGSEFIQQITRKQEQEPACGRPAFVIGVSTNLQEHGSRLRENGADWVWPKPPPSMTLELKRMLLEAVMTKRKNGISH